MAGNFTCCPLAGPGIDLFEGHGASHFVAMSFGLVCLTLFLMITSGDAFQEGGHSQK